MRVLAVLQDLIKMADVVVTLKIMPESVKIDLKKLEKEVLVLIKKHGGDVGKVDIENVAFGLKCINFVFVIDEDKGMEELEKSVERIKDVRSVEIVDVRRAIG